jgi:cytochrome P450
MADDASAIARDARARAYSTPLEDFQVADLDHFTTDTHWPWFERLRREDPVHYCADSEYGPYWSITRFQDIVAVDSNHEVFSSASMHGGIMIADNPEPSEDSSFIALDPPNHDAQRRVVTPIFSTAGMAGLEPLIRERAAAILDELPVGETFDFVDKVSVELTSQMLATLFDYPFDQRRNLPRMSDMILTRPRVGEDAPSQEALQAAPLRRQPPGRDAAARRLGRDPQALQADRGGGRAPPAEVELRQGLRGPSGAHRRLTRGGGLRVRTAAALRAGPPGPAPGRGRVPPSACRGRDRLPSRR